MLMYYFLLSGGRPAMLPSQAIDDFGTVVDIGLTATGPGWSWGWYAYVTQQVDVDEEL